MPGRCASGSHGPCKYSSSSPRRSCRPTSAPAMCRSARVASSTSRRVALRRRDRSRARKARRKMQHGRGARASYRRYSGRFRPLLAFDVDLDSGIARFPARPKPAGDQHGGHERRQHGSFQIRSLRFSGLFIQHHDRIGVGTLCRQSAQPGSNGFRPTEAMRRGSSKKVFTASRSPEPRLMRA